MIRLIFLVGAAVWLLAQPEMPPGPVGYTEARQRVIQGRLTLPGTVVSSVMSLVASEVAGLVVEYPVSEGDRVEKGQVLARLNKRSRELDSAAIEAQLREAEARLKLAERNHERAKELFASGVFSQQQLDDTLYEFNAWEGRIDNLRAEIDRIRYDISRSVIGAPFAGVVVAKHTELGQWLGIGGAVVELLSLEELDIRVDVPEQYYRDVKPGGAATVALDALSGRTVRGKVVAVIPKADPQARTFPVKVRVPSAGLGVGMLAQVSLQGVSAGAGGVRTAIVVPKDAVVRQGSQTMVFLINGEGSVSPAQVQTGQGIGDWVEVRGPVTPGAKVVTRGNERLTPGQKVRGEPVEYALP